MNTGNNRIIFLDNIRSLVVVFVVVLHAACAYAEIIPWWPVQEFPKQLGYTLLILFFDLFCMPALFFVAGYFAPASLRRHGAAGFMGAKLRRLGGPLVLLALFYVPLMSYVGYVGRTPDATGFFDFWLYQLSTAWKPVFVLLASPEAAIPRANDFSQWHLWFISLLLLMFLAYAALTRLLPFLSTKSEGRAASRGEMAGFMLLTALVVSVSVAVSCMLVPGWSWATIGGYVMFQPTRLGMYAALFCLGVVAANRRWFEASGLPGSMWLWLGAALVLDVAFVGMSKRFIEVPGALPPSLAVANGALRGFACIAWLGVLIKGAQRWLNAPRPVLADLSRSSYDIYLLHLPIIVWLQLAATFVPMGFGFKFVLEALIAIPVCWLISRNLIRSRPRVAMGALAVFFAAACLML